LGHLCGIGAGLLYVKGPLKPLVEIPTRLLENIVTGGNHVPAPNPQRFVAYQGPLDNNNGHFVGNAAPAPRYYHPYGAQIPNNNYHGNNYNDDQFFGETPAQRAARLRNLRNY